MTDWIRYSCPVSFHPFKAKSSQDEYTLRDGQLVPIATGRDNDWAEVDENEVTETLQDLDKAFSEALTKSMQEIFGDQGLFIMFVRLSVSQATYSCTEFALSSCYIMKQWSH